MTAADDTGAWDRAAVWAHEAGHAEGETDILEAADSLYSYGWVHDEPSQLDTERWQAWFGPNEGGTAFHAGDGSTVAAGIRGGGGAEIGRATCRERVCPYVSISGVAVALKKKRK